MVVVSAVLRFVSDPLSHPGLRSIHRLRAGDQLEVSGTSVQPTGYEALDACLPGGGWSAGVLSEILFPSQQALEWQLVAPALAERLAAQRGSAVLVGPAHEPFGPVLERRGLPAHRLCRVDVQDRSSRLWACEQALNCQDVAAVLAWLPAAPYAALRRLHVMASRRGVLFWVFRAEELQTSSSPAALRLVVHQVQAAGAHQLQVRIAKRRGPPLHDVSFLPGTDMRLGQVLGTMAQQQAEVPFTVPFIARGTAPAAADILPLRPLQAVMPLDKSVLAGVRQKKLLHERA